MIADLVEEGIVDNYRHCRCWSTTFENIKTVKPCT